MSALKNHISFLSSVFLVLYCLLCPIDAVAQDAPDDESDYISQIEETFGVVEDPEVLQRVGAIAGRLLGVIPEARTDDREIVFKVLDDDSVNAFALPDGHVYLFRGLLDECETDDMLAGVMAHELTHVFHHHHSHMGERQIRGMLIGMAAMVATGEGEGMILGQMLAASMVETYGRSAENDADRTGAIRMVEAGYDPVGYLELMEILEQEAIHRPEPGGNYFTIHPNPDERMANIRATLRELGVEVPANVYRVHLPLAFYLPLSQEEAERLSEWESALSASVQETEDVESADDTVSDEPEVPLSLLREYRERRDLFEGIAEPSGGAHGVVTVGDRGVFYIAEDSEDALRRRGDGIIERLGDKFLNGLRNYEVQARAVEGTPVLLAGRRIIAYTTDADASLLGLTPDEANKLRVDTLKDILYRYYVNRRI